MKKEINFEKDVKRKLLMFSIIPLFVFAALLIAKIYFLMEDSSARHHKITLINIDHRLNLFVDNIDKKASILVKDPDIDLKSMIETDEYINFIFFLDNQGNILKSVKKEKVKISDKTIKNLYKKFIKEKKSFFLYQKLSGDLKTLFYVFEANDKIGILNVNLKEIREYIEFIKKREKFEIALVDKKGEYVFCTSKNIDTKELFFKSEIYEKSVKCHKELTYFEFYNSKMGIDNFFMYIKNKKLGWTIFVVDESEALDDKVLVMIGWTILFVVIIILFILSLSDKLVNKILNPLEDLISKMEVFANSYDTQELKIESEYIFFQKLSNSFNKMQMKIVQREKELENLNKTLEQKVKEEVEKNRIKDQQLINQNRLVQMGEMLSMIAHQWRQPLSAISSLGGKIVLMARLNKLDKEKTLEIANKVIEYTQHLSDTIDDFRNFFRENKEKVDATYTEVVEQVLGIIEVSVNNKNIKLIKDLKSEEVFNTYINEIKQVVLNLIKNAEDALVERNVKNPKITIQSRGRILRVKDNAGGVPEEIMDKIFDPYFSTKEKKDGTGLGLYMSKMIIEDNCGGKLRVYNDEEGAVFEIEL